MFRFNINKYFFNIVIKKLTIYIYIFLYLYIYYLYENLFLIEMYILRKKYNNIIRMMSSILDINIRHLTLMIKIIFKIFYLV